MRSVTLIHGFSTVLTLAGLLWGTPALAERGEERQPTIAEATLNPAFISWTPHVQYAALNLRVALPTGRVLSKQFAPGQPVGLNVVDERGKPLPDGSYTYELVVTPQIDPSVKEAIAQAREAGDDTIIEQLQEQGLLPRHPITQTGYFSVTGGSIVMPVPEQ